MLLRSVVHPPINAQSIARPTCEALEKNNIAGPILTDPELHKQYLGYVREFTESVYANKTFIDELTELQAAQDPFVREDFWSVFGTFFDKELSPDASNWEEEEDRFPLLPTMKARAADVLAQLDAIDAGTFPRGPHEIGALGDNEPLEYCPDWRMEEYNSTGCELGCKYDGCHELGWTVESFCDEDTATCIHGDYDEQCRGILDGQQYPDMADTDDGRKTFCRIAEGVPIKAAECPAPGALTASTSSGIAITNVLMTFLCVAGTILALVVI